MGLLFGLLDQLLETVVWLPAGFLGWFLHVVSQISIFIRVCPVCICVFTLLAHSHSTYKKCTQSIRVQFNEWLRGTTTQGPVFIFKFCTFFSSETCGQGAFWVAEWTLSMCFFNTGVRGGAHQLQASSDLLNEVQSSQTQWTAAQVPTVSPCPVNHLPPLSWTERGKSESMPGNPVPPLSSGNNNLSKSVPSSTIWG